MRDINTSLLTEGSRNAVKPVSPLIKAKTNETMAETISILTSKSSNCFKTNFQNGAPAYLKKTRLTTFKIKLGEYLQRSSFVGQNNYS